MLGRRARVRPRHVTLALRTNSNLSRRGRARHARARSSLRMVGLITFLIIIPLVGALALYIGQPKNARIVALIFNALSGFYALMLWQKFDATSPLLQAVERHPWIPTLGAEYVV